MPLPALWTFLESMAMADRLLHLLLSMHLILAHSSLLALSPTLHPPILQGTVILLHPKHLSYSCKLSPILSRWPDHHLQVFLFTISTPQLIPSLLLDIPSLLYTFSLLSPSTLFTPQVPFTSLIFTAWILDLWLSFNIHISLECQCQNIILSQSVFLLPCSLSFLSSYTLMICTL